MYLTINEDGYVKLSSFWPLLIFCVALPAFGQALDFRLGGNRYMLGMSGDLVESDTVRARVLSIDVGGRLEGKLNEELSYHVWLMGSFENGSNKATGVIAEYEPNQAINLREGGLIYRPFSFLRLDMGSLNQNDFQSPLLVWNTAFAGLSQKLHFGGFYLRAMQAIPNNNILTRRAGGIDEGNPLFTTGTLGYQLKSDDLNLHLAFTRYSFRGLSSQVAINSKDLGNSTNGIGAATRFLYGFEGNNVASDINWKFKKNWQIQANGQYLFNEKAPDGRNQGYLAEIGAGLSDFTVRVGTFKNESDTAPAFYNARTFGHNNVKGEILSLVSQGHDYFMRVSYVNSKTIGFNVHQTDMQIINFTMVRNYDF